MALLTKDELRSLVADGDGPAVSVYTPTERQGKETRQNPIRFKNLVRSARDALGTSGLTPSEADALLAPARRLLEDVDFWQHQADGLAVFVGPDRMFCYRVPLPVESLSVVGRRFHIKPLLPLLSRDGRFYILAVSRRRVRLLEATHWSVRTLDVPGMPQSLEEALNLDVPEKHLQFRTGTGDGGAGGAKGAIFHGHGAGKDLERDRTREFCRLIDAAVHAVLREEHAPLVLAATELLRAVYREVTGYGHVWDGAVNGNPDHVSEDELRDRAWSLVEPGFLAAQTEAAGLVEQALATDRGAGDLRKVVRAAHAGRVEVLFVPLGVHRWGRYEPETRSVVVHEQGAPGDEDLLDGAAAQVLLHWGTVYAVEPGAVPGGQLEAAALFRY